MIDSNLIISWIFFTENFSHIVKSESYFGNFLSTGTFAVANSVFGMLFSDQRYSGSPNNILPS